jgi:hypothetical protein
MMVIIICKFIINKINFSKTFVILLNILVGVVEKHPRFGENHSKRDEKHAK